MLNFGIVATSSVGFNVYGTKFEAFWCVHSCGAVV